MKISKNRDISVFNGRIERYSPLTWIGFPLTGGHSERGRGWPGYTGNSDTLIPVFINDHVHVRYRDPDDVETIRTSEWADNVSYSVVEGSEVRMWKRIDSDEWDPQSILIQTPLEETEARQQADEILEIIAE